MAEGFKSNPAVVGPHAALTDTAEWHIARCKMNDRVIDTAAAKTAWYLRPSSVPFVLTEKIKRKRMRWGFHGIKRLV